MPVKLHPHQVEGVAKLHNGCILYGDVGVGKTITSLAYYFTKVCGGEINKWGSMQTPKDVYVITTAKVRDSKGFELQAAHFGVHTDPAISTNGVRITVDSWNNLHKYVEVKDAFFIFDEQRVVGYGAWARAFIKIARSNEWILLSATPGDTWLDYIPVFIANGWYKHKTDFLDQHVIWTPRVKYPKVLRYQGVNKLVKHRNQVLVHMPYERHTVRHAVDVKVDYDGDLFEKAVKKRWHVYEERPLRDVSELFSVMRKIVNSHSSRLEAVRELSTRHPKLIVFYNFDYELEMLRTLVPHDQLASDASIRDLKLTLDTDPARRKEAWRKKSSPKSPPSTQLTESPETSSSMASTYPNTDSTESEASSGDSWDYLLSPEGMVANCPGHWTVDQGDGEEMYHCHSKVSGSPCISRTQSGGTQPTTSSTQLVPNSTEPSSAKGQTASFAIAEWNGHKHEEIPKTDRWIYLVQYRAGAEGWNCVETDAIVFYSQTYSYRDWWQAHGRIDRLNTPFTNLWYYHLISSSVIDKAIRAALRVKKNFNERDLAI